MPLTKLKLLRTGLLQLIVLSLDVQPGNVSCYDFFFFFFLFFLPKSSQRFVNPFVDPSYRFYSACCAALFATLSALCCLFLYILLWIYFLKTGRLKPLFCFYSLLEWMTGPPQAPDRSFISACLAQHLASCESSPYCLLLWKKRKSGHIGGSVGPLIAIRMCRVF